MEYIYIGKIVNTHGIKGEVRILSRFDFKEKVFVPNTLIYIGEEKIEEKIVSYRKHKSFDMVLLGGINDINDVLKYKGKNVYISSSSLKLSDNEILDEDLIGFTALYENKEIGIVNDIMDYGNKVLKINESLIPYNENFILKLDKENKKIYLKNVEGLIK